MHTVPISDQIHLLGLGCGGSYTAEHIAKRGAAYVHELHGYDGDVVDQSNTKSQTYLPRHVNMKKVDALAEQVAEWGSISLIRHPAHVEKPIPLSGYVFLAVDSMETRMRIYEESIENNDAIKLMIEMRLETTGALIHVIDPTNVVHKKKWRHYWNPDSEATNGGSCGAEVSMGPIASLTASVCVWQMVRDAHRRMRGLHDRIDTQIRINMVPLRIETFQW